MTNETKTETAQAIAEKALARTEIQRAIRIGLDNPPDTLEGARDQFEDFAAALREYFAADEVLDRALTARG